MAMEMTSRVDSPGNRTCTWRSLWTAAGAGPWLADCRARRVTAPAAPRCERAVEAALERGIRVLTLFTFSTDNWGRPETEVAELMRTFEDFFRVDAPALVARGVRVTVIGRRDRLPVSLREAIEEIEAASAAGGQMHVRFAIDYSGREAILHAARRFQQIRR